MRNTVMTMLVLLMLSIGSISCEMGTSFDEVVVDNSVQDHTGTDTEDIGKPGTGGGGD